MTERRTPAASSVFLAACGFFFLILVLAAPTALAVEPSSLRVVGAAPSESPMAPGAVRSSEYDTHGLGAHETAPAANQDEIILISTRDLGAATSPAEMVKDLRCQRQIAGRQGGEWQNLTWSQTLKILERPLPTVAYVHGNRIESGEDRQQGLAMYRAVRASRGSAAPMRFVIWSWPSTQIRGLVKDYKAKAALTRPVAWQLAWTIDQVPANSPVAVIGYSYGARVVTGALHLLAGGELDGLALGRRVHPHRPPLKVALLAAALDADWLRPGGYHGRALTQVDRLVLVANRLDPIMRFYHLTSEGQGVNALGYAGPVGIAGGSALAQRVRTVDVTEAVGRHHAFAEYMGAGGPVVGPLQQLVQSALAPGGPATKMAKFLRFPPPGRAM